VAQDPGRGRTGRARTAGAAEEEETPEQAQIERLRADKTGLTAELARTQAALEVAGKVHALLEMLSGSAEPPAPSTPSSTRR